MQSRRHVRRVLGGHQTQRSRTAPSDVDELRAAIETLEVAVVAAPRSVNAQVALAVALARAGETARAVPPLEEEAMKPVPRNPLAHRNLGICLLQSSRAKGGAPALRVRDCPDPVC
jgi:Flp pilus assembly protein TadD